MKDIDINIHIIILIILILLIVYHSGFKLGCSIKPINYENFQNYKFYGLNNLNPNVINRLKNENYNNTLNTIYP